MRTWVKAVVGGCITLVGAPLFVWWLTTRSADLVATAQFTAIEYPPVLIQSLEDLESDLKNDVSIISERIESHLNSFDSTKLRDSFYEGDGFKALSHPDQERIVTDLDAVLRSLDQSRIGFRLFRDCSRLESPFMVGEYLEFPTRWPTGLWTVVIKNEGSTEAEAVNIDLPDAVLAKVAVPGKPSVVLEIDELVEIDSIQSNREVRILAWTDSNPSYDDEVGLSHKNGVGTVNVKVPASRTLVTTLHILYTGWWFFIPMLALLILSIVPLVRARRAAEPHRQPTNLPQTDENA